MKKLSKAKAVSKPVKKVGKSAPKTPAPKAAIKGSPKGKPKEPVKSPTEDFRLPPPVEPLSSSDPAKDRMTKMLDIISRFPGGKNFKK